MDQPSTAHVTTRFDRAFLLLMIAQTAHSTEEYLGRLYDVFPPARMVSSMFSRDPAQGFLIVNTLLVAFGFWCYLWPVRRGWRSAVGLAWFWAVIELVNGIGHPLLSLRASGYTPGVVSATLLLIIDLHLIRRLRGLQHP